MTFDTCDAILESFRRKQGTRWPLVRIDFGGTVIRGRLTRTDSDRREELNSPYGLLVVADPGLARSPETILQIADIPEDGLRELTGD